MKNPRLDVIGYWSEVKLDIIRRYATEYSKIITANNRIRRHSYIDGFAGAGEHISKRTGDFVAGSPLNALFVTPPFTEVHLIDLDGTRADRLREIVGARHDVFVYEGDANEILLEKVFRDATMKTFIEACVYLIPTHCQ